MKDNNQYLVIGSFADAHLAVGALETLRTDGLQDQCNYYSPFPEHHLEDEFFHGRKRSPVRRFTLLGASTGCLGAFLFTSWMSVDYPLRVSAKPLISIPAFVVIAFECTILLGAIFTLASMLLFGGIPNPFKAPGRLPQFTEGTFGVTVTVDRARKEEMEKKLKSLGAVSVESQYVA